MHYLFFLFILVLIIKIIIYPLAKWMIKGVWQKGFKPVQWRAIRIKDLYQPLCGILVIVIFEFFAPSLSLTGQADEIELPSQELSAPYKEWSVKDWTYDQIGQQTDWLKSFTAEAQQQYQVEMSALEAQLAPLKADLKVAEKKHKQKKAIYDAMAKKMENASDRKKHFAELSSLQADSYSAGIEVSILKNKITKIEQNTPDHLKRAKLSAPHQKYPNFNQPIRLIHHRSEVILSKKNTLKEQKNPQNNDLDFVVEIQKGPDLIDIKDRAYAFVAQFINAMSNQYRPNQISKIDFSCYIAPSPVSGETKLDRFCEIAYPLAIDYDLTSNKCSENSTAATDFLKGSNLSTCHEKWIFPYFHIRISEKYLEITPPKPLNNVYRPQDSSAYSLWQLDWQGQYHDLDKTVTLALPQQAKDRSFLHLWHIPALHHDQKIRIWQDVEAVTKFSDHRPYLQDNGYREQHKFIGHMLSLPLGHYLKAALIFVDSQIQVPKDDFEQIEAYDLIFKQIKKISEDMEILAHIPYPSCQFAKSTDSPSFTQQVLARGDYKHLDPLFIGDSRTPECQPLNSLGMTIEALQDNLHKRYQQIYGTAFTQISNK